MNNLGHWVTSCHIPDNMFGFIYRITNIASTEGKMYLGKKICQFKTTKKPLKGRVNKRHDFIDSGWKYYTGSCSKLNKDIDLMGKEVFKFEIIKVCKNKFELAYYETLAILNENALMDLRYYNEYLQIRLRNPKL